MKSTLTRVLVSSLALVLAGASTGCVDEARCDAALAGVARVRAEAAQRGAVSDAQIAWLRWWQTTMAAQVQGLVVNAGDDALRSKLAALEVENAALAQRLARAERRLEAAAPIDGAPSAQAAQAPPAARRLDEAVPYDLTGFLARPRPSGKREASGAGGKAEASHRLDERRAFGAREPAPQRTLDETVPYD